MSPTIARLGKRVVESSVPPASGETKIWDTEVKGFLVRIYPSGRRTYALKYRLGSRQCTMSLGVHGSPQTPEGAREAALEALRLVKVGRDPGGERVARAAAKTVSELIDAYLCDGPPTKPTKRQSTWVTDASNLNRHIRPLLGRRVVDSLTMPEAARAIRDIAIGKTACSGPGKKPRARICVTGGESTAKRARTTAAAMCAWGIKHGLVQGNPFAGVEVGLTTARERFLDAAEIARLLMTLERSPGSGLASPDVCDSIRLLLLTGARKTEILGLRWSEVDLVRHILTLPPERTKAGGKTGCRYIVLSIDASEILRRRQAAASGDFVFPANSVSGHLIGLRKPFMRILDAADIKDFRIHDLRHSFASLAIANGASLYELSKALGHASSRTTERYAHLTNDPLRALADSVGAAVMSSSGRRTAPDRPIGENQ